MKAARGRTLLVIEDDPLNLELLATVLEAAGFTVHGAADARAGLELAARLRPDAVLMDIQLPEMDGLEATRALHAAAATAQVPVIAVSAHVKKEDEERSREAGCVRHISKPVDTRALPGIVAEVIAAAAAGVGCGSPRARESRSA
jgi:two-component system, cell cycle response regulator DivK